MAGAAAAVNTVKRLRDETGTSLIEVVIALGIFLVLLFAVLLVLDSATRAERGGEARHVALLEVRSAMHRISKDLRQATSIAPSSTTDRIEIDTLIAGEPHGIVFEVAGGEIRRIIDGGNPVPLADDVTTATPFCFDPPDCVATSPGSPSMVRVTLDVEPEVFASGPLTLVTDIKLRNL